jgi:hypothetical protein
MTTLYVVVAQLFLGGVAGAGVAADPATVREVELESQLDRPVEPLPMVNVIFDGFEFPGYRLRSAAFSLDGKPLSYDAASPVPLLFAGRMSVGGHDLEVTLRYEESAGTGWFQYDSHRIDVSGTVVLMAEQGLRSDIHVKVEREGVNGLTLTTYANAVMVRPVDDTLPAEPARAVAAPSEPAPAAPVNAVADLSPVPTEAAPVAIAESLPIVRPLNHKPRAAKSSVAPTRVFFVQAEDTEGVPVNLAAPAEPQSFLDTVVALSSDAVTLPTASLKKTGAVPALVVVLGALMLVMLAVVLWISRTRPPVGRGHGGPVA